MTSIAVSSRKVPITINDSCIRIRITHGLRPSRRVNRSSMALTAPNPSKTAPKARAARMIHMNMHVMPRVLRTEFSNTSRVIRPFSIAARNAVIAPIAALSTNDVQPFTKGTIMTAKITRGSKPARNSRSFSARGTSRSSGFNAGPNTGFFQQRRTIYSINRPAIINPGTTPASQSCPTGCRAIIA